MATSEPMTVPITATAVLSSEGAPTDVIARLQRLPVGTPARFEQPDATTLLVRAGSRLRYRLLGAWSGGQHLPVRLRFDVESAGDGTLIRLAMTSDEGWYLFQTSLGEDAYGARFTGLLAAMEAEGFTVTA